MTSATPAVSDSAPSADDGSRKFDGAPALPARVSLWCLQGFAPAALAGAVIALVAPLTFVRVLGLVALGAGLLGTLLHLYLLRRDHPAAWNGWFDAQRARVDRPRARWSREHASASGLRDSRAHGFARFTPAMAQEN